ncbi:hypothetical protein [Methylocystis echinoides]|uniref:Uncharacterized protein n=1 Tax=Methylocystis echinoides TaxID=29468 RepID=A0A9W6GUI1_9HYPH|nr:hypothetical protein [Methylocystis echinoides]GLI93287.1 hypothetical protein LMG27198_22790 [Methylocystis echinoides]
MTDDAPDLFGHTPPQGDLFGGDSPAATPKVDPAAIRLRLQAMLDDIRAARDESPWSSATTQLNKLLFPQMANWLPAVERDALRMAFEAELARLGLT